MKIDSGQPKIVENELGLLVGFKMTGSEVNGNAATESLLVDFGEIAPSKAGTARWIMECTLSGRFVEFAAEYSHSDELGGRLTSLIDSNSIHTHTLVHDVLVDLAGRDATRDFLAKERNGVSRLRVGQYRHDGHRYEFGERVGIDGRFRQPANLFIDGAANVRPLVRTEVLRLLRRSCDRVGSAFGR